jgi:hypothetical protein
MYNYVIIVKISLSLELLTTFTLEDKGGEINLVTFLLSCQKCERLLTLRVTAALTQSQTAYSEKKFKIFQLSKTIVIMKLISVVLLLCFHSLI